MSDVVLIAIGSALLNAAVVWGVVRTELKYLRRDVDHAHERLDVFLDRKGAR